MLGCDTQPPNTHLLFFIFSKGRLYNLCVVCCTKKSLSHLKKGKQKEEAVGTQLQTGLCVSLTFSRDTHLMENLFLSFFLFFSFLFFLLRIIKFFSLISYILTQQEGA